MTPALAAFEVLQRLRYPSDLTVAPDARRLGFACGSTTPDHRQVPYVVDLGAGRCSEIACPPGSWYGVTRFGAEADRLVAARGVEGGELETIVEMDIATGEVLSEVSLDGAIEDLTWIGERRWLARVADPGADRDGMHLGTRVFGFGDPLVDSPLRRWRRLTVVDLETCSVRPVPTPGWSIWEADVRDGVVLAVASGEPKPAGYYHASLVRVPLEAATSAEPTVDVLHRVERQLSRPRLSPCGRHAFVIEGRSIVAGRVRRIDLEASSHALLDDIDDVTDLGFTSDGGLWLCGWSDRGVRIETRSADGATTIDRVVLAATAGGRDGQPSLCPVGPRRVAMVLDSPDAPPEVRLLSTRTGTHEAVTSLNGAVAETMTSEEHVPQHREFAWTSPDGTEVHAGLLLPPSGRATERLPLVVLVHGGPTWLWSTGFAPAESNQLAVPLACAGAAVMLANPRGSSGRGQDYADAIAGHIGRRDVDDVLAGIDHLVAEGLVDPERIGVIGTSYGGYLAAWLAATTSRFRCAVSFSCVSDWCSFSMSSNLAGGFDAVYFPGVDITTPAGREELASRSPVFRAAGTTTPIQIIHGSEDRTTPIGQAEQLLYAWRAAGAEAELVVYPREGHELVEPRHRHDAARRVLSFLEQHGILT